MPTNPIPHHLSISCPGRRSGPPVPGPSAGVPGEVASPGSASRQRALLFDEIRVLEQAIAAPARDPGWRRRVGTRLGWLRNAFSLHMVVTEGPEGLYAELLEHAPRLARGVHGLVREHATVVATMADLRRRVDLPEVTVAELRDWTTGLLGELSRHRQHGADLVYDAYQTDIGGET